MPAACCSNRAACCQERIIDKVIAACFLTIATIAIIVAIIGGVMPGVDMSIAAINSREESFGDSISSATEVVEVTTEGDSQVDVWIKNIGGATIREPTLLYTLFGPQGDQSRFNHGGVGCTAPCWEMSPGSDDPWVPSATVGLRLHLATPLVRGQRYVIQAITIGQHQANASFLYEGGLTPGPTFTPTNTFTPTPTPTDTPTPTETSTPTETPTETPTP